MSHAGIREWSQGAEVEDSEPQRTLRRFTARSSGSDSQLSLEERIKRIEEHLGFERDFENEQRVQQKGSPPLQSVDPSSGSEYRHDGPPRRFRLSRDDDGQVHHVETLADSSLFTMG